MLHFYVAVLFIMHCVDCCGFDLVNGFMFHFVRFEFCVVGFVIIFYWLTVTNLVVAGADDDDDNRYVWFS